MLEEFLRNSNCAAEQQEPEFPEGLAGIRLFLRSERGKKVKISPRGSIWWGKWEYGALAGALLPSCWRWTDPMVGM